MSLNLLFPFMSKVLICCQIFFKFYLFICLFIYLFIYLFMAVLGLRFCARAFSSCGKWGPLLIAVRRPLTIKASLVAEHGLQTCRLSDCGSRAQLLRGMWDLPRPGLEPVSSALAGRFSTTEPPGKPCCQTFKEMKSSPSCYCKRLQIATGVREIIIRCVQMASLLEKTNRDDD